MLCHRALFSLMEAEDLLRDKPLGCFLVRLSDKAVGYILSYKGLNRCRHFVITQNEDGQFVVTGDCQTHHSVTELIEHYKLRPILPFGEYLTSSYCECVQESSDELYDVVSFGPGDKTGVSVQALRILWDPHSAPCRNLSVQQQQPDTLPPPALPLKSKSRKLTGTVSAEVTSFSQAAPSLPQRGVPLGVSLSGSLSDTTSHEVSEPQAESNASERCSPGVTYSELVESRSRSLDSTMEEEEEEEEYSNRLRSPSFTTSASYSTTPLRRVICQTYSLHQPAAQRPSADGDVEMLRSNPLYQSAEGSGGRSAQQRDDMYAEVPGRPTPTGPPEVSYEQITVIKGNTYESLDEMMTRNLLSTSGKNNKKWKKFLPEYMKK
ncbi:putative SH2 domain-containing protein 7-like [Scophthalmus maximus]|uniref:Putative SH2 domain-containing protein 7-like n=1 Tax=Scophthalmus maximus TaxID=52904 RepID=A0A2U9BAT1_SCOMX|nr:putative SH2 domain-containing protein 7-like [Scophthalmus maximus]